MYNARTQVRQDGEAAEMIIQEEITYFLHYDKYLLGTYYIVLPITVHIMNEV